MVTGVGMAFAGVGIWTIVIGVFLIVGLNLYQAYFWLKTGTWHSLTLAEEGVVIPHTTWIGVNKIIDYFVYEMPLTMVLFVVGGVVGIVALLLANVIFDRPPAKKPY